MIDNHAAFVVITIHTYTCHFLHVAERFDLGCVCLAIAGLISLLLTLLAIDCGTIRRWIDRRVEFPPGRKPEFTVACKLHIQVVIYSAMIYDKSRELCFSLSRQPPFPPAPSLHVFLFL